jgi:hypothetical protein
VTGTLPTSCTLPDGTSIAYYSFTGTKNGIVTGTMTTTTFNPELTLIDPSDNVITSAVGLNPGTETVSLGLPSSGNWQWGVTSPQTSASGSYTFKFTCGGAPPPTCTSSDANLCLNSARFQVQATFDAGHGNSGQAHTVQLTSDTGYMWFFAGTNVEAVVKVLDACSLNNHFWFFAGGLTNVAVTLTVTDTLKGVSKVYHNPQGTTFVPIQDTSAFATCP